MTVSSGFAAALDVGAMGRCTRELPKFNYESSRFIQGGNVGRFDFYAAAALCFPLALRKVLEPGLAVHAARLVEGVLSCNFLTKL